jgi:hypothetical protein
MPTPSGLPKAGDRFYNAYFKQVFVVTGRSSTSYPMTVYVQPTAGKEFPPEMRSDRMRPDGTYGIVLEGDVQDLFRMGAVQWTFVPDPNQTSVFKKVCTRTDTHASHLYMPKRTWFLCPGVTTAEAAFNRGGPAFPTSDQAFATWYGREFGVELDASETDEADMALRSAFEAGRDFENERLKGVR